MTFIIYRELGEGTTKLRHTQNQSKQTPNHTFLAQLSKNQFLSITTNKHKKNLRIIECETHHSPCNGALFSHSDRIQEQVTNVVEHEFRSRRKEMNSNRSNTSNVGEVFGPEGAEHARSMESSHTHDLTHFLHFRIENQSGRKTQKQTEPRDGLLVGL